MSQNTKTVIALRFDTQAEVEYLISVVEENMNSVEGVLAEADEILKALKDCTEMFKSRVAMEKAAIGEGVKDVVEETSYQEEPSDPRQAYINKIIGDGDGTD